jgi:hypothetical protein
MIYWRDVKEFVPSKEHKYIVCLINGYPVLATVHFSTFTLTKGSVSFYWPTQQWIKDDYFGEVTHWMALPSPPKESINEK